MGGKEKGAILATFTRSRVKGLGRGGWQDFHWVVRKESRESLNISVCVCVLCVCLCVCGQLELLRGEFGTAS